MNSLDGRISKRIVAALFVLVVLFGGWKITGGTFRNPDSDLYQVVLSSNDQAFYGKLHDVRSDFPYLTDVYYLNPQAPYENGGSGFTVIKRGYDEMHQPTDEMYFQRTNILFWENVGRDSLVAQGIVADKKWRAEQAAKAEANTLK